MTTPIGKSVNSSLKAWMRALERTASLERSPSTTFPCVVDELAGRYHSKPALVGRGSALSYQALSESANRYARWALSQGLMSGDVVCLLLENSPDYMAIWVGLNRVGIIVALLNTHLRGPVLAHSIRIVAPRAVIAGASFRGSLSAAMLHLPSGISGWIHGAGPVDNLHPLDELVSGMPSWPLTATESRCPQLDDRALYIYTSGTTGLPKAAVVSHRRIMQWTHWFAGMMGTSPDDRMYDCLPMYHSIGGIVATGATLVGGGTVVLRERFSAGEFWQDVTMEGCTLFQYIGELCRYLTTSAPNPKETRHSLRLACGNGLRPEIWERFQDRFRIPQILEYYASTEGNFSLYNCEGKPGAIGRIPPFLAHRLPVALVQFEHETGMPRRDPTGRCILCSPNEVGEAIGQVHDAAGRQTGRFEGYVDESASRVKVLRDVFVEGDAWYRTGDLMRRDQHGFFYFVDRVGDTFRWKGENVSTSEVAAVIAACPGVEEAVVYGVTVPGADGRAGMAAIVVSAKFNLASLRDHVVAHLPDYASPVFVRTVPAIDVTGTFKSKKQDLAAQAYDLAAVSDSIYFDDKHGKAYVRLDAPLLDEIRSGRRRL